MQAIIFIGIQASGKSTFYQRHFFNTHVRISLDLLRTRHREQQFLRTCLTTSAKFVVDNTNPLPADRERYLTAAKEKKYQVVAYYFMTPLTDALKRNRLREGKQRIKDVGLYDCQKKLTPPSFDEGFDQIFEVRLVPHGFEVQEWERPSSSEPALQASPVFANRKIDWTLQGQEKGVYTCASCGEALFSAAHKFDSKTGFPSFWAHLSDHVQQRLLQTYGRQRLQLLCHRCGQHLGHLFPDDRTPSRLRYCINAESIQFKPETPTS